MSPAPYVAYAPGYVYPPSVYPGVSVGVGFYPRAHAYRYDGRPIRSVPLRRPRYFSEPLNRLDWVGFALFGWMPYQQELSMKPSNFPAKRGLY
jgi:hypothetical protein